MGQPAAHASRRSAAWPFFVHDELAAERRGQHADLRPVQIRAHVREIGASHGGRVQVDSVIGTRDELVEDNPRQTAGEAAVTRTGEATVQIAAVWQITRVLLETERVQDRNQDQRSAVEAQCLIADQPPNGPGSIDFVPMQRGRDKYNGSVVLPATDVERNLDGAATITFANLQRQVASFARSDPQIVPLFNRSSWSHGGDRL